jgi:hypothetical protein
VITTVEIDDETYEEIIKVRGRSRAGFRGFRVSGFRGFRVSGFPDFNVEGFLGS